MILILKNKNNEQIEISHDSSYTLISIEGLGIDDVNIYSSKSPNQNGESYIGNTLPIRSIPIKAKIVADNKEDMIRKRNQLLRVANPKLGKLELTYINGNQERKIKGIPEIVSLPPEKNFGDYVQSALIELYCPNPYWNSIADTKVDVSTEEGNFEFPLEIPAKGIELSIRTINFITNIYNHGNVETPIKIILEATGNVTSPMIENLNTGEFIRVKRKLLKGDKLEINTEFGNKRVEILRKDESRQNVFNFIDYKSTFFSIEPGDTKIKYDAEVGNNNLDVYIYYTPRYIGV